ncbi:MAG TPA: biotin/lipoyl-binding protein [Candidatus Paceibacterota bacterium]|nr:biotin/lipoyl-binding protein [Candidatus Paceibacterota bacterium]
MSNFVIKIKSYWVVIFIVIIVALVAGYFVWAKNGNGKEEILVVEAGDFVQTVSVSGKVIPAKSVELGFNKSGRVTQVPVSVGQRIATGQLIAEIDSTEAWLALENAKIDLKKMIEDKDSTSLAGLTKDEEDGLTKINEVFLDLPVVINGFKDVLDNYRLSPYLSNLPNNTARSYHLKAQTSYYQSLKQYQKVLADYRNSGQSISGIEVVNLTEETYLMLQNLTQMAKDSNLYINYVYDYYLVNAGTVSDSVLVADRTNIGAWLQIASDNLTAITASRNTLKNSSFNLEAQKLVVSQKEHDYENHFLHAPFAGIITRLDIKVGELVTAGQANVAMDGVGLFQIESFIPEVYIANLKVGNSAEVTLDAYGSTVVFSAKIISIDPAETIRDGISTYKTTLQFLAENPRIKSGMTANLLITSLEKSDTIAIPSGAIISNDGQKIVKLKIGEEVVDQSVVLGETGALGLTEVVSGLKVGDKVILNPETK